MDVENTSECLTRCMCDGPGQCPCYGVVMNEGLHAKCKSSADWRANFARFFDAMAAEEIKAATAAREGAALERARQDILRKKEEYEQLDLALAEIHSQSDGSDVTGLGDLVENVFSKFGITKERVEKVLGTQGCGCDKRKQFLNSIFPFVRKNDEKKKEADPE